MKLGSEKRTKKLPKNRKNLNESEIETEMNELVRKKNYFTQ